LQSLFGHHRADQFRNGGAQGFVGGGLSNARNALICWPMKPEVSRLAVSPCKKYMDWPVGAT
jgi:hypothetical protein